MDTNDLPGDAPKPGSSLLDDLLRQTQVQATLEKQKLEQMLQDKADDLRRRKEEEEFKKREDLKRRLEEETRRRQDLLRKKRGEVDPVEEAEVKEEREQAVAQVLATSHSAVARIEKKASIWPVLVPSLVVIAGLAAGLIALFLQVQELPTGLKGYSSSLAVGVDAAITRARVKNVELQMVKIDEEATAGNRVVIEVRKQMEEKTARIVALEKQIEELMAQIDGKAAAKKRRNDARRKKEADEIKINGDIFRKGKAR
jgi:hypothetical protein